MANYSACTRNMLSKVCSVFLLAFFVNILTLTSPYLSLADNPETQEQTSPATKPIISLPPVVVTATRTEKEVFNAPASVVLVDGKKLEMEQSSTLKEALEFIPNVDFSDGTNPISQKITIRGGNSNQTIMLIDGARQNYTSASGLAPSSAFVDPYLLKSVEVKRGPSSVLYGSSGMGGVVSLRTKDAADLLRPGENFGAAARVGYNSESRQFMESLSAYGRYGIWDMLAQGILRDTGDTTTTRPGSDNHGHNDGRYGSLLTKISASPTEDQKISLAYHYDRGNSEASRTVSRFTNLQHRIAGNYDLRHGDLVDLSATLQYEWREFEYENDLPRKLRDKFYSIGGTVQNTSRFATGSFLSHALTYGIDIYFDEQKGWANGELDESRPHVTSQDYGFFIQDELSLTRYVDIIPAVRYTAYERTPKGKVGGGKQSDEEVTPQVTLQINPLDWLSFYGTFAKTFRPPSPDEIYFQTEYLYPGFGIYILPNTSLRSESGKTLETGINVHADSVLADGDFLGLKVTYFRDRIKNLISTAMVDGPDPANLYYQMINVNRVKRWGLELEAEYRLKGFELNAGYGKVLGRDRDTDLPVGGSPDKYSFRIAYTFEDLGLTPYWKSRFVNEYETWDGSGVREKYSAYDVHGLGISWRPNSGSLEGLQVDFYVDNIFDKRYVVPPMGGFAGGGYDMGQSFRLTAGYRF